MPLVTLSDHVYHSIVKYAARSGIWYMINSTTYIHLHYTSPCIIYTLPSHIPIPQNRIDLHADLDLQQRAHHLTDFPAALDDLLGLQLLRTQLLWDLPAPSRKSFSSSSRVFIPPPLPHSSIKPAPTLDRMHRRRPDPNRNGMCTPTYPHLHTYTS